MYKKLLSIHLFILTFLLPFLAYEVQAQTEAGGVLTTNTTWTLSESPVSITDSLIVEEEVTLTVEPGVVVEFNAETALIIQGALNADGTDTDSIKFTSAAATPEAGDWAGITFENNTGVGSSFSYAVVEYGGFGSTGSNIYYRTGAYGVPISQTTIQHSSGNGIDVRASDPQLDQIMVSQNSGYGVFSDTFSNFELIGSTVSDNDTGGIRVPVNASPTITGNVIENNDYGIFNDEDAYPTILDNEILNNRIGLHFIELGSTLPELQNNDIAGNSEFGLRNVTTAGRTLIAERNFWGDDSGPYHPGSNPTGEGDRVSDYVEFDPWNIEAGDLTVEEVTTDITVDTDWDNGVYWVKNSIDIDNGVTLTINPGVVVKFASDADIEAYGTLNAQGTEEDRIVFTSEKDDSYGGNTDGDPESVPERGDWRYLYLRNAGSVIEHSILRFGGGSSGTIVIRDGLHTLNNLTLTNSGDSGIRFFSGNGSMVMSNITASANNGSGIEGGSDYVMEISNSEFIENADYGVESTSGSGIVRLLENSTLERNGSGGLRNTTATGQQTFLNNTVRDNQGHGLWVANSDEEILFEANIVEGNRSDGVVSSSARFIDNELRDNRYPIGVTNRLGNRYVDDQDNDGNIIENNRFDNAISVFTGIRDTLDTVFPEAIPQPVYVAVEHLTVGNYLEIEPGVVFKFEDGRRLRMSNGSELYAVGTEEDPVVFTSWRDTTWGGWTHAPEATDFAQKGDWSYVEFRSGSSRESRLKHVVASYGRYNFIFRELLNSPVDNLYSHNASSYGSYLLSDGQVVFENSRFEDNDGEAIYVTSNNEATVRNSVIRNNNDDGLGAVSGSAFREISNSIIEDNSGHGIFVSAATIPQTFKGNTIRNNGASGIWNNNTDAEPEEVQFIGNQVSDNAQDGIVSSRARFIDNTITGNRYPIGVTDRLGNIYVDAEGDDGNVIDNNAFNKAIAAYTGIRDTLSTVFPEEISEPVYVAVEHLSIGNDLVIDPGVIFKFEDSNRIRITNGGELQALGTEQEPVVFTSWRDTTWGGWTHEPDMEETVQKGDWSYLEFRSGSSRDSRLEHVVLQYGIYNLLFREPLNHPVGHIHSQNASRYGSYLLSDGRVTFENSIIENNDDEGIYLSSNTEATVRNSIVRNNGDHGLNASNGSGFREVSTSTIEGNNGTGIQIGRGEIPQTFSGNTVRDNRGHGMNINALNDNVDTLLVVNGNEVLDNDNVGVFTSRAHISDNTVSGNQFGLGVRNQLSLEGSGNPAGSIFSGNDFTGNTYPPEAIMLGSNIYGKIGYTFPQQIQWEQGERPVYVTLNNNISVDSDEELDIGAGSVFKLDGQRMQINGKLTAEGQADDKIVFTSWKDDTYGGDTNADSTETVPEPGDWSSLRIYGAVHDDSYMNHFIVRYANYNLDIRDNDMVIDSLFTAHSNSYGAYIRDASPTFNYSEIHSNPTGIYVWGDSEPTVRYSNIRDSEDYGIENRSDLTTMATNNYWGDESGPFVDDPSDPNLEGEGDAISMNDGRVEYDPWLTSRTGILLGDVNESGVISAYDASLVLQFLTNQVTLTSTQEQAADVMGDGSVTAMDASYVLQFVVGKISGFPGMGRLLPEQEILAGVDFNSESTDRYQDLIIELSGEREAYAAELVLDIDMEAISEVEHIATTLSDDVSVETNMEDGLFMLAAASSEAIEEAGQWIHLRLHFDPDTGLRGRDLFSLDQFRFNQYDLTDYFEESVTSASDQLTDMPEEFKLEQNYPNPFNPVTVIPYQLPAEANVTLTVYNILGQQVQVLVDEEQRPGFYEARFDASSLSSGTYLYRINVDSENAGSYRDVGKMILVK